MGDERNLRCEGVKDITAIGLGDPMIDSLESLSAVEGSPPAQHFKIPKRPSI